MIAGGVGSKKANVVHLESKHDHAAWRSSWIRSSAPHVRVRCMSECLYDFLQKMAHLPKLFSLEPCLDCSLHSARGEPTWGHPHPPCIVPDSSKHVCVNIRQSEKLMSRVDSVDCGVATPN